MKLTILVHCLVIFNSFVYPVDSKNEYSKVKNSLETFSSALWPVLDDKISLQTILEQSNITSECVNALETVVAAIGRNELWATKCK